MNNTKKIFSTTVILRATLDVLILEKRITGLLVVWNWRKSKQFCFLSPTVITKNNVSKNLYYYYGFDDGKRASYDKQPALFNLKNVNFAFMTSSFSFYAYSNSFNTNF